MRLNDVVAVLTILSAGAGCAGVHGSSSSEDPARARAEEVVDRFVAELATRPGATWGADDALSAMMQVYEPLAGAPAWRAEVEGRAWSAFDAYFDRVHDEVMAKDPGLAQQLSTTQFYVYAYYSKATAPVLAERFRAEGEAVAAMRQALYQERQDFARSNEMTCVTADHPFAAPGAAPQPLRFHFARPAEVHVRCLFPTSLESQVSGAVGYTIEGKAYVKGIVGDARLTEAPTVVPIESARIMAERYVDFAFDLATVTNGSSMGFIRVDAEVTLKDAYGRDSSQNDAFARITYE